MDPYLGEIKLMSFAFAPAGWAQCNGQLLPINQNAALFSLLGTNYGGNGTTNFALPDLRGRVPIHNGLGYVLGQRGGTQSIVLNPSQLPVHRHGLYASPQAGNQTTPAGHVLARSPAAVYRAEAQVTAAVAGVTQVGGNQPHENRQPFTVLNFCIALTGIYPSQS